MTEPTPSHNTPTPAKNNEPTSFSPAKKMYVTKVEQQAGISHGSPERHIQAIFDSIKDFLDQSGIDPSSVLFSGYDESNEESEKEKSLVGKSEIASELDAVSKEANRLYADGYFDDHPDERIKYQEQIQSLKDRLGDAKPIYYFADFSSLQHDELNPIEYAAMSGKPAIGIYDKKALEKLPGYFTSGALVHSSIDETRVEASLEEIKAARIATVYPYYFDEGGEPLKA